MTQTFDLNGNLMGRGTRSFAWDHRNRLTGVDDSGSGLDWDADYDHNDRIYKRVVDGVQVDLIYDDFGRLLAEIKVNPSGADELMASYLWDGIGLAAEKRGGQVRYPVYDGLGTVQLWLDEEGEVLEAPRFDEWGVPTVTSASPFGYTGRWGGFADAATGDVLNWHRWYGPSQGNWLSRDPIGVMGGENVYGYVSNRVPNLIDRDGLDAIWVTGILRGSSGIGGGVNGGFVFFTDPLDFGLFYGGEVAAGVGGTAVIGAGWQRDDRDNFGSQSLNCNLPLGAIGLTGIFDPGLEFQGFEVSGGYGGDFSWTIGQRNTYTSRDAIQRFLNELYRFLRTPNPSMGWPGVLGLR